MQIKYKIASLFIAFIALSLSVYGQNTPNQDVRVVREYTPTVSDAVKIDQMPTGDDTTTYRPMFSYSVLSRAFQPTNELEPLTAARMESERQLALENSQLKLGVGTYNSAFIDFDYNILRSKDYALRLNLSHLTSMGKVSLLDNKKVEAPFHDTEAGIDMKRFFSDITLRSGISFKHQLYNYYGYESINDAYLYINPNDLINPLTVNDINYENKQRLGQFSGYIGLKNNVTDLNELKWDGEISLSTFGNRTGVSQNRLDIVGDIRFPQDKLFIHIKPQITSYGVKVPFLANSPYLFNDKQITLIQVLPTVGFLFDGGFLETGLLIAGEIGRGNDETRFSPHIYTEYRIVDGIVSIMGGLTGRLNLNDYATIQFENPFISPDEMVKSSFYGLDFHAGLKGNFSRTVAFSTMVNYSVFNDEHFYVNKAYEQTTSVSAFDSDNLFGVVYDDGNLLKVNGELQIEASKSVMLSFRGTYYGWNVKNELKAWNKPNSEISIGGIYKFNSSLSVNSQINIIGKRYALNVASQAPYELKSLFDMNVGANYQLNKKWSFWLQLNNLTSQTYDWYYGYPLQRFNGMVGFTLSF